MRKNQNNNIYNVEKTGIMDIKKEQQFSKVKDNNAEIENKNIILTNDSIFFEGKEYKKFSRYNTIIQKGRLKKIYINVLILGRMIRKEEQQTNLFFVMPELNILSQDKISNQVIL